MEWFDEGDLTDEEKQVIEQRLNDYEKDPGAGSSWEKVEARIRAKLRAK